MKITTTELIDSIFNLWRLMKEHMSVDSPVTHLTIVQIQTLIFLKHCDQVPMNKIASYLKIELPSTTSLINKLVAEGLVERKQDAIDRRIVFISLTKKGDDLMSQGMKQRSKRMEKILSPLSQEDKDHLFRILSSISANFEENEK